MPSSRSRALKKVVIALLKFGVPVLIIAWLLTRVPPEQLDQRLSRDNHWGLLAAGFALALAAVLLTFLRWYLLVAALRLPFRVADALRLGFLGFLLNFVSAGAVGGDLFKAFFIAREQPGRRAEAVATVVVDRVIGLYALLIVTTAAILLVSVPNPTAEVQTICNLTYLATGIGGAGILMLIVPGFTSGSLSEMLAGIPRLGPLFERLIAAVRMYRRQPATLCIAMLMSISTHVGFAIALWVIAGALFPNVPSLGQHFIIVPLSLVAGALPFTPAGFGAFEFAMDELYRIVPGNHGSQASGVLVALAFRLNTILIAAVGIVYYWTSRREVQRVLHDASADDEN